MWPRLKRMTQRMPWRALQKVGNTKNTAPLQRKRGTPPYPHPLPPPPFEDKQVNAPTHKRRAALRGILVHHKIGPAPVVALQGRRGSRVQPWHFRSRTELGAAASWRRPQRAHQVDALPPVEVLLPDLEHLPAEKYLHAEHPASDPWAFVDMSRLCPCTRHAAPGAPSYHVVALSPEVEILHLISQRPAEDRTPEQQEDGCQEGRPVKPQHPRWLPDQRSV